MEYRRVVLDGEMSMSVSLDGDMSLDPTMMNGEFGVVTVVHDSPAAMNYNLLRNKPQIESVELIGNKTFNDLGLTSMTADDLLEILV